MQGGDFCTAVHVFRWGCNGKRVRAYLLLDGKDSVLEQRGMSCPAETAVQCPVRKDMPSERECRTTGSFRECFLYTHGLLSADIFPKQ